MRYFLIRVSWILVNCFYAEILASYKVPEPNDLVVLPSCRNQFSESSVENAIITFIIPSKGRSTLNRTMRSLLAQTDERWVAIIVFDGVLSNSFYISKTTNIPVFINSISRDILTDRRFCFQYRPISGRESNCAAEIRNYGILMATTEWVGFVDDDDTLESKYVEHVLHQSKEYPTAEAILFRMCQYFPDQQNVRLIPDVTAESMVLNDVGISFTVKRQLFQSRNYSLISSNAEDFLFMDKLYQDGVPILMSAYNAYKVKDLNHEACNQPSSQILLERPLEMKPKYAEFINCSLRSITFPNFTFTEENSVLFKPNIQGLKSSLLQSMKNRCFSDNNPINDPIHIVFGVNEKPLSPFYIQVQLEQRDTFHFTPEYRQKLSDALQIWEFSVGQTVVKNIPGIKTSVYFIPTMLTLLNTIVYKCPSRDASRSAEIFAQKRANGKYDLRPANPFMVYRYGKYYTCEWSGKKFILTKTADSTCNTKALSEDEYCWASSPMKRNSSILSYTVNPTTICMDVVHGSTSFDVLNFGLLTGSYMNQREKLCDLLSSNGLNALCVQGVYGYLLNHLVCTSKIIVVNHYFRGSALETHRIDPLLQANKVVVATISTSALESYYSRAIPIVSYNKILPLVTKILSNFDDWVTKTKYYPRVRKLVQMMTTTVDPLCFALSNLPSKLKERQEQESIYHLERNQREEIHNSQLQMFQLVKKISVLEKRLQLFGLLGIIVLLISSVWILVFCFRGVLDKIISNRKC